MTKTLFELDCEKKKKWNTENNTYDMFPVGTRVHIITPCQDFNFFYDETGVVTKNTGEYLGIIVKFDEERHFSDGYIQKWFGFNPDDLLPLNVPNKLFEME